MTSTFPEVYKKAVNRLSQLIAKLIFSPVTGHWTKAFVGNHREHHDSGGSLYAARCLLLWLYLAAHFDTPEMERHHDAQIEAHIPTPWGKLRLGFAVCSHSQPDCMSGVYLRLDPPERPPRRQSVAPTFNGEVPF